MKMENKPDISVVTNVSPNHLDWHKDMDEYVEAKKNIFKHQDKTLLTRFFSCHAVLLCCFAELQHTTPPNYTNFNIIHHLSCFVNILNAKNLTFLPHQPFLGTKPQQSASKPAKNPIILLSLWVVCALARVIHNVRARESDTENTEKKTKQPRSQIMMLF